MGEVQRRARAVAQAAVDLEPRAEQRGDADAHREAEAEAVVDALIEGVGLRERLEGASPRLLAHALAGVLNAEADLAGALIEGSD